MPRTVSTKELQANILELTQAVTSLVQVVQAQQPTVKTTNHPVIQDLKTDNPKNDGQGELLVIEHIGSWTFLTFTGKPSSADRQDLVRAGYKYTDKRGKWHNQGKGTEDDIQTFVTLEITVSPNVKVITKEYSK